MARILDTIPAFEAYARKAGLESPLRREMLWTELYESAHPAAFEAFSSVHGSTGGRQAVVKELGRVRERVKVAAPAMRDIVEEVDAGLPALLGLAPERAPLHVLIVGHFTTNAAVARMGGDVAVFHCLEWFQTPETARILTAHEGTHGWHEIALGEAPPADDPAWTAFAEGLALAASRAAVPGQPEVDYFWYGHPEVDDWLPWCRQNRQELLRHFRVSLDIPEATDTYFGGGLVDGKWRVGFYIADELITSLGRSLPELVAMTVDEAKAAVVDALDRALAE